ncbi:hypothetical protein BDZ91DRAFT_710268, partial [Kalaharituber pfeilii]
MLCRRLSALPAWQQPPAQSLGRQLRRSPARPRGAREYSSCGCAPRIAETAEGSPRAVGGGGPDACPHRYNSAAAQAATPSPTAAQPAFLRKRALTFPLAAAPASQRQIRAFATTRSTNLFGRFGSSSPSSSPQKKNTGPAAGGKPDSDPQRHKSTANEAGGGQAAGESAQEGTGYQP